MNGNFLELKKILIKCFLVFFLIFLILFYFSEEIYTYFALPLLKQFPEGNVMISTHVSSAFFIPIKLVFFLSLFLIMPYLLYNVWSFISPGLYYYEKKIFLPYLFCSVLLFYFGIFFSFYVVSPMIFNFFYSKLPQGVEIMTDITNYFNFMISLLFSVGILFQIPIFTIGIVKLNILTKQQLIENRPYLIVASFTIAMFLTPPDVFSQILLAIPMCLLYEVGILILKYF